MSFREFLHQVPFLRLLLPFTLGIVLAEFFLLPTNLIFIFLGIAFTGLCLFQLIPVFRKSYAHSYVFGLFIFLLIFSFGQFRVSQVNADMQLNNIDSISSFKGKLKRNSDEKTNSMACVLELEAVNQRGIWNKSDAQILLYLAKDSLSKSLKFGDHILVSSKLNRVRNNGNPYEFDYATYLKHRSILYSTYAPGNLWCITERNERLSLKGQALVWREKLLHIYKRTGLKDEAYEILSALTLGARDEVSDDVKQVWTSAGATHVLAVSGLHVGIIFGIMQFLLSFMARSKTGRILRAVILIISLWLYALLTGLSPSVMRAACMFSILALGLAINRKGTIYNSLAISAFLLLLIDPYVLFQVGFQFSYLAVISIVYFQPKFESLLLFHSFILRWSWKLFTVSVAAQIGTFPLAIFYFHQFPTYFFLSNFVIIPFAGLLIYGSALLLIFSEVNVLSKALAYLLQHFVELIHWLIYQIQILPGALIERITISSFQIVLIYVFIIGLIISIKWKKRKLVHLSLIFLIAFKLTTFSNRYLNRSSEMVVFNTHKHTVVCFRDDQHVLILSDILLDEKMKTRLIYPYTMAKGVKYFQYDTLKDNDWRVFNDRTVALVGNSSLGKYVTDLPADYIIMRNNAYSMKNHLPELQRGVLIRDGSNIGMKTDVLSAWTWDTQKSGAYISIFK
ncbi:ComEC family competence protein [Ancylomarina salipaludis]|uniref:ComEC family competence protein n=1 Tax=Ancylomarina salipaludis TaxID=2501299 RepID=A0A4Q1JPA6_9BACT|nr:ComEC/Rec2 family competence protein [Ancylomarina salipaludis]RXQ96075.1 ComEC family competence protein [Ancylomarina salipaludis]